MLTGVILAAPVAHLLHSDLDFEFEHPLHTQATTFQNFGTSTSTLASGAAVEWFAFRAQLAQPVEILHDGVREYLPVARTFDLS